MTLNELGDRAVENAKRHEFDGLLRSVGDSMALIHSEVSEAFECYRNAEMEELVVDGKPCGYPTELADVIIRTLETARWFGIDIAGVVERKMAYNETRPVKHGGKRL